MNATSYNVLVGSNVVACGLFSFDEAEYVRQCWLDVFPYLIVTIQSVSISLECGDSLV